MSDQNGERRPFTITCVEPALDRPDRPYFTARVTPAGGKTFRVDNESGSWYATIDGVRHPVLFALASELQKKVKNRQDELAELRQNAAVARDALVAENGRLPD
jgi:hypothetical protein